MASFTVDPAVLNEKAAALIQHADEYDSISGQLKRAATTMGSAYDSADNKAFVGRVEECAKDLKAMADKLRAAAQTLKGQAANYSETEKFNTQKASHLPG